MTERTDRAPLHKMSNNEQHRTHRASNSKIFFAKLLYENPVSTRETDRNNQLSKRNLAKLLDEQLESSRIAGRSKNSTLNLDISTINTSTEMVEAVQQHMSSFMSTIKEKFESEKQELVSKIKELEYQNKSIQQELAERNTQLEESRRECEYLKTCFPPVPTVREDIFPFLEKSLKVFKEAFETQDWSLTHWLSGDSLQNSLNMHSIYKLIDGAFPSGFSPEEPFRNLLDPAVEVSYFDFENCFQQGHKYVKSSFLDPQPTKSDVLKSAKIRNNFIVLDLTEKILEQNEQIKRLKTEKNLEAFFFTSFSRQLSKCFAKEKKTLEGVIDGKNQEVATWRLKMEEFEQDQMPDQQKFFEVGETQLTLSSTQRPIIMQSNLGEEEEGENAADCEQLNSDGPHYSQKNFDMPRMISPHKIAYISSPRSMVQHQSVNKNSPGDHLRMQARRLPLGENRSGEKLNKSIPDKLARAQKSPGYSHDSPRESYFGSSLEKSRQRLNSSSKKRTSKLNLSSMDEDCVGFARRFCSDISHDTLNLSNIHFENNDANEFWHTVKIDDKPTSRFQLKDEEPHNNQTYLQSVSEKADESNLNFSFHDEPLGVDKDGLNKSRQILKTSILKHISDQSFLKNASKLLNASEVESLREINENLLSKIMKIDDERAGIYKTVERLIQEKNDLLEKEYRARTENLRLDRELQRFKDQYGLERGELDREKKKIEVMKEKIYKERDRLLKKKEELKLKAKQLVELQKKGSEVELSALIKTKQTEAKKKTFEEEWERMEERKAELSKMELMVQREWETASAELQRAEKIVDENKKLQEKLKKEHDSSKSQINNEYAKIDKTREALRQEKEELVNERQRLRDIEIELNQEKDDLETLRSEFEGQIEVVLKKNALIECQSMRLIQEKEGIEHDKKTISRVLPRVSNLLSKMSTSKL